MTTDKCFSCERKDGSSLCEICGVGLNGEREHYKRKPITNADSIRSLSDIQLALFLYWQADGSGKTLQQWQEWLKEEVRGGGT